MQLVQRMSRLGTETAFEVNAKVTALEAGGKSVIKLHIGAPDFLTPENIVEAGRKALADGHHKYTDARGILPLREAVAEDIQKRRGAEVDPDCILIVPGGKPTMAYAILMFGEPGTEILYPNPGFPIYESMIKFSGRHARADPSCARKRTASRSSAETPCSSQITPRTRAVDHPEHAGQPDRRRRAAQAELDKLAKPARRSTRTSRSSADEIYSRLLYDGEEHVDHARSTRRMRDRTILLDGWSKTYGDDRLAAGLRSVARRSWIDSRRAASRSTPSRAPTPHDADRRASRRCAGPRTRSTRCVAAFDERRKP